MASGQEDYALTPEEEAKLPGNETLLDDAGQVSNNKSCFPLPLLSPTARLPTRLLFHFRSTGQAR